MTDEAISLEDMQAWARERMSRDTELVKDWRRWLPTMFGPSLTRKDGTATGFAPYHVEFWDWVWSINRGMVPRPFVAIWPRGAGKTTSAELACVALAARKKRSFGLYVCATQSKANDRVSAIGAKFQSSTLSLRMPGVGEQFVSMVGKRGEWRRSRIRTMAFGMEAVGLDVAIRGIKLEDERPDFMVFDDVDEKTDSAETTDKKIAAISNSILPAGQAASLAVLCCQNLVHADSIFARLAGVSEKPIEILQNRIVSGPWPAVDGLEITQEEGGAYRITGGTATWEGQSLTDCQNALEVEGPTAFREERQHEVTVVKGGMYDHVTWKRVDAADVPDLVRVAVWVDPAVTDTDASDSQAIHVEGLATDGRCYSLFSWEQRTSPQQAMALALAKAVEYGATSVGVETDQGGDTWESVYREMWGEVHGAHLARGGERLRRPRFRQAKAGQGHGSKASRQALVLQEYERDQIRHVRGTCDVLERALTRFPKSKPFDLADARYWSWADLRDRIKEREEPEAMGGLVMPVIVSGGWGR